MKKKDMNLLIIGVLFFLWIRNRGTVSGGSNGFGGGADAY